METFLKTLKRLEYLDYLIRLKATGSPKNWPKE